MGIKIGLVGLGAFAQDFVPLYKAHPLVDEITFCDLDAEKLARNAAQHGIAKTSPSLDHLLTTDIDAAVIISQNWMHGPQALQALRAGKHVYSAVPMGITIDEIGAIVRAVEETGQIYMMGETSYYYPGAMYCREKVARGEFGHLVYAEGEYYHDWDHGLYDVMKWRGGENWLKHAGSPPMHYPTHSTGQVISVIGGYATHVSCHGFVDRKDDQVYRPDSNIWRNRFSNQTALFTMSDGSCMRINEFRRCGHPGVERLAAVVGTEASFEQNVAGAAWLTKHTVENVTALLECSGGHLGMAKSPDWGKFKVYDTVHPSERLPKAFLTQKNGHHGSHQFLVDDFLKACVEHKTPPVNAWAAARYTIPGIVAHESSIRDGERLAVPDFGDPKF